MIHEKCDPLRQLPDVWLKQLVDTNYSLEGIPYGGLMSSAASCGDDVVFCDQGTQTWNCFYLFLMVEFFFEALDRFLLVYQ